ncbi:uncharacterized protein LOC125296826 [Xyrichtys novacula]|uniref:Uncharacterized protein LOC125296826 n=1 Tax=Xyrichtys novacula TaxID=13765 RepID=A0AAV1G8E3_XYRNO|nr:uncharacterized protein LOC125296826 [Xyrichtys novacula]
METSARQPNFSQEETDALVREVQSRSGRIYGHANRPPRVDDAKAAWEEQHTTREEEEEEEEEEEQQQQVVGGEEKEGEDEDDREEEDQGEPEPVPETREGAGRGEEPATRGRRRNRVQREDQPFLDTQRAGFLMLERELGSMGTRLGSLEAQVKALQEVLQASLLPLAAGVATLQRLVQVENAVRQGKTGLACTDRQNKWNAGSQRNAGQRKMKDVQFKQHYRQKIYQPSTTMQSSTTTSSTTTNSRQEARLFGTREEWRKHVLASPMAGLFTCPGSSLLQLCLDADPSPMTPQSPPLHNLSHDDHHTPLSCRKCRTFYDDYVNMPTAQLENTEKLTKAQSKVQLWHDMRRVRITASTARKVPIRSTTSPEKFLSEHLYPTFHGNAATHHGAVSEEHARQFTIHKAIPSKTKALWCAQPNHGSQQVQTE